MKLINKIKDFAIKIYTQVISFAIKLFTTVINFTTGLGFYGLGLIAISVALYFIGIAYGGFYINIASGFLGAFIFKNIVVIKDYIKSIKLKKKSAKEHERMIMIQKRIDSKQ